MGWLAICMRGVRGFSADLIVCRFMFDRGFIVRLFWGTWDIDRGAWAICEMDTVFMVLWVSWALPNYFQEVIL